MFNGTFTLAPQERKNIAGFKINDSARFNHTHRKRRHHKHGSQITFVLSADTIRQHFITDTIKVCCHLVQHDGQTRK